MVRTKRPPSSPPQPRVYLLPEEPSLQHLHRQLRHLPRTLLRLQRRHPDCSEGEGNGGGHRGRGACQLHQEMGERGPRCPHLLDVHGLRPVGVPGLYRALPDLSVQRLNLRRLQSVRPVGTMRFPHRGGRGGVREDEERRDVEGGDGGGGNEIVLRRCWSFRYSANKLVVP